MNKQTIIKYKKIYFNGDKRIKILGWENILGVDDLPKSYIKARPKYYQTMGVDGRNKTFEICMKDGGTIWVAEGMICSCDYFQKIVSEMKKAGAILHKINRKKQWSGIEEIKI